MVYKLAIASLHFFLASFMIVQLYAPMSEMFGENEYLRTLIFFVVSVSVFYLSYRKADSKHYSFKTVLIVTAGYWLVSTILILAKLPYLNIVLIIGFYYFLIKENPEEVSEPDTAESKDETIAGDALSRNNG